MTEKRSPGIYLIVEFDWPNPVDAETAKKAFHLHQVVKGAGWIQSAVAASHGVGKGAASIWIFKLEGYSALERLFRDPSDEVYKAYNDFFSAMPLVNTAIREEVLFG
ncbi:MAG: hypothetical protein H6634_07375 [Anaerolineales bacterium]|nr:hypothetical protein [Anaerolineales bacterium]MCB9111054.1 hypothetical protein [Anaerolineales bacterium]